MTSGSTCEFLALCAIAQHFGRPGMPTDQAWIESFFGHIKAEFPHLCAIANPAVLRAELGVLRAPLQRRPSARRRRLRHPARRARRTRSGHPQCTRGRTRNGPPPTSRLPSKPTPAATRPETRRCWLIETDLYREVGTGQCWWWEWEGRALARWRWWQVRAQVPGFPLGAVFGCRDRTFDSVDREPNVSLS
jgi:hypothetical protein